MVNRADAEAAGRETREPATPNASNSEPVSLSRVGTARPAAWEPGAADLAAIAGSGCKAFDLSSRQGRAGVSPCTPDRTFFFGPRAKRTRIVGRLKAPE